MQNENPAPPTINQQMTARYMQNMKSCERVIEATYLQGFDEGSRVALNLVSQRIQTDANQNDYTPPVKEALLQVAQFIHAVATGGTIGAGTKIAADGSETNLPEGNNQGATNGNVQENESNAEENHS